MGASVLLSPTLHAQSPDDSIENPVGIENNASIDDTVVVTANRNVLARVADVPQSIAVISGDDIQQLGTPDIRDVTGLLGNLKWNHGNQQGFSLSVRGIGKQGVTIGQDPSVGVVVDGVSYAENSLIGALNLVDVDTVSVYRGPQGTRFGKSASLGLIEINTKAPSFDPDAEYGLTFGQRGRLRSWLAAGGVVVDGLLASRVTATIERGEGALKNAYNDDSTFSNIDRAFGRAQFLLTPTHDFSARLSLEAAPKVGENRNGGTIRTRTPTYYADGETKVDRSTDAEGRLSRRWFTDLSTYSYERDYLSTSYVNNDGYQPIVTEGYGASLDLKWDDIGAGHSLRSITAYQDYHFNARYNDDGTLFIITPTSGGGDKDITQVSQEFRLASSPGKLVDYTAGIYLLHYELDHDSNSSWGPDGGAYFANAAQYDLLDSNAEGRYLMKNSVDQLWKRNNVYRIDNDSAAAFAHLTWHLSKSVDLQTGARATYEDRRNLAAQYIVSNGVAGELNPAAIRGISAGGFNSNGAGALTGTNTIEQLSLADYTAVKYFGKTIGGNPGDTYNSLTTTQKQQVAYAKAIRAARIGVLVDPTEAEAFTGVQPNWFVSPSWQINANETVYVSWQYGEKGGVSQIINGVPFLVGAEKNSAYELGLKSTLLEGDLLFNVALYWQDIKDYQQNTVVVDPYTTQANNDNTTYYTTVLGSVPKVRAKGIEIDGVYTGLSHTAIRFSGAYNDARYRYFPNQGLPDEENYTRPEKSRDVSGEALPGASKYTGSVLVDYRVPVFSDKAFHINWSTIYNSRFNSSNTLSSYGWIPSSSVTNVALGLGRRDERFDVSILARNLFGDDTPYERTWNSYSPAEPRWLGLQFTGKLY